VNRRSFLLGLGAIACGTTPARPPQRKRKAPDDAATIIHRDEEFHFANELPSAVSMYRDSIVFVSRHGQLRFFDARMMSPTFAIEAWSHAQCFLQDGLLAALLQPRAHRCEIHLIDPFGEVRVLSCPDIETAIDAELVRGGSPTELFVSDASYDLVRLELRNDGVRKTGRMRVPLSPWKRLRQLASLEDGRVVTRGRDALFVHEPSHLAVELAIGRTNAIHVATAGSARIWYSHTTKWESPREATLVRVGASALDVLAHVDLAPAAIWHLAAHDGALAALLMRERTWSIAVFDDSGRERWRVELGEGDLRSSYIAIGEHRVVIANATTEELRAWDAATGAPVG
jgi:hypothetical protein